jgi:hypothetical protein
VAITLTLPSLAPLGDYSVFLHLKDADDDLVTNPHFSIRLANEGLWESATGYNNLLHTLTISGQTVGFSESILAGGNFWIYPNPVDEYLMMSAPMAWAVYDLSGSLLLVGFGNLIDTRELAPGVYLLRTEMGVRKFVKW